MNNGKNQPLATYRLQFTADFRLKDAGGLVPYFSRLGITHVYASPLLRARQGSTHGYDMVDPKMLNPNLGDEGDLVSLVTDLRHFGLGLVLDIVPNHMAASIENPYWRDVLTYGPSSPFAGWFDIDWRMPDPAMWGRVLVPVLGAPRARVLEQHQIRVVWSDGRFLLQYFDAIFPVDPATVPMICGFGMDDLTSLLGEANPTLDQIRDILARLQKLPKLVARLRRRVHIDRDEIEQWLGQFARLIVQSPRIEQWAAETAERFGQGADGQERLRKLLDRQPYRLVHWRDAARAINYRRFFDINELISVRQEDPHVFDETHATVLRWVNDGLIDGLRIDHIDGLRDPLGYLERLAASLSAIDRAGRSLPVFVEKILAADEKLPAAWPVAGTTGYEFLNQVEAVFISRDGFSQIEEEYRRMLRRPVRFAQVASWGKRRILQNALAPQVGRLAELLLRLAERSASRSAFVADEAIAASASASADADDAVAVNEPVLNTAATALAERFELTKDELVDALVEVVVALPVYRTYVDARQGKLSEADRQYVEMALHGAYRMGRASPAAIEFLGTVLTLENADRLPEPAVQERINFIQRFQQLTGPAAAKGVEDTALYAFVPLVSLNEVGGEPHLPDSDPVAALHAANEERSIARPQSMLCVTTHDTKRTADVRARLDVLSELPTLWTGLVRRWRRLNRKFARKVRGKRAPDAAEEYLLYQTIVGLWPAPDRDQPQLLPPVETRAELHERIAGYMLKAIREAKIHTSWTRINAPFEETVLSFVQHVLLDTGDESSPFLSDVQALVTRIARPGFWNSLSRTLVQFTAPGTPDLYQGDELWNFALVDPDNRRPVDYAHRQCLLDEIVTEIDGEEESRRRFLRHLVDAPEDGRVKLHLLRTALLARRELPHVFAGGSYVPLKATGRATDHVAAYARVARRPNGTFPAAADAAAAPPHDAVIVIVPRLTTALLAEPSAAPIGDAVWADTHVPLPDSLCGRSWTCALTLEQVTPTPDDTLPLSGALQLFPAALLVSRD